MQCVVTIIAGVKAGSVGASIYCIAEREVKTHPYAELFPMMADDELRELADDISTNGQQEDVVTLDGAILDGRNRYRACQMAGVEPMTRGYLGDDPLAFVLSKNLNRRHLDASQRGMVAARIANMKKGKPANSPVYDSKVSQESAASQLNVGERIVRDAKRVQEQGAPELVAAVDAGKVSVNAASEVAKLPKDEQKELLAKGPEAVKDAAKKKRKARQQKKPEPVNQPNDAHGDQNTPVQVSQETPSPEEPDEDESTVMGKLNALLKEVKKLVKKNPLLAKDAAVAIHEVGEEVIEFTPPLKFGEQRPIYDSPYFRNKGGDYEGPTVQHLEDVGSKAIDTYGKPVPQHLRDEFCDDGYSRIGRHLELAVAELQQADDLYQKMSARPMGVHWCKTQTWNAGFTKAAQMLDDVTAKWWSESVPFTVCRFCMGAMKNAEGIRCLKCNFSGYWPRSEARSHPTMIQDKRPKAATKQEDKS